MNNLRIEHLSRSSGTISGDIVKHIQQHTTQGRVAIVAEHPLSMLSVLRKKWLKAEWKLRRQRSSTLNPESIRRLTFELNQMQARTFTAKPPRDDPIGDVLISDIEQFVAFPPMCNTLYIVQPISKEQLHLVTTWMPRGGTVILCNDHQ